MITSKYVSALGVATLTLATPFMALANAGAEGEGYHGYGHMMGGYAHHGMGHGLLMVLAVVAVIAIVYLLVRRACPRHRHGAGRTASALSMLSERYARGEIDTAEYEERRRVLGNPDAK